VIEFCIISLDLSSIGLRRGTVLPSFFGEDNGLKLQARLAIPLSTLSADCYRLLVIASCSACLVYKCFLVRDVGVFWCVSYFALVTGARLFGKFLGVN
jgi:hypothetical protein